MEYKEIPEISPTDDRRNEREDRRKISIEELFDGGDIDFSQLGITEDRRSGNRRGSIEDRKDPPEE